MPGATGSDYASPSRGALILALAVGLPFLIFVPTVARVAGAVAVGVVLVVSFHELLRMDRMAFTSIAVLAGGFVLIGFVMPWRAALALDEAVAVFFCLLTFMRGTFAPWWWRVVLRRPHGAFAIKLAHELRDLADLIKPALQKGDWRDGSVASIERQLDRVRALDAPTNEWSALRDAYLDQWDVTLSLAHRSANAEAWDAEVENARRRNLQARFDELAARR